MLKSRVMLAVTALALVVGCGAERPNQRLILRYEKGLDFRDLDSYLRQAGPGPVAVIDLGRNAWVSHHLVVVREAETPHYHRFHDLTVFMLRGEGVITLEGKRFMMRAGDVAYVHRGVRHFFRNTGTDPAVAFVTLSPPFDGRDTVTAEEPSAEPPTAPAKSGSPPEGAPSGEAPAGRESVSPPVGGTGGAGTATEGGQR
jgi:mannose-6-phosphate isomerase-like protein (cupin superfamily)